MDSALSGIDAARHSHHVQEIPVTCVLDSDSNSEDYVMPPSNLKLIPPVELNHNCKFCKKIFPTRNECIKHEKTCDNFYVIPKPTSSGLPDSTLSSNLEIKKNKCRFCPQRFVSRGSCTRHEKSCQANSNRHQTNSVYTCKFCGYTSGRKDHFDAHFRRCSGKHSSGVCDNNVQLNGSVPPSPLNSSGQPKKLCTGKSKTPCLFPNCELEFYHKNALINHLQNDHEGVEISPPIHMKFDDMEKFIEWKDEEQERTCSYFSQKNGVAANSKVKYFFCQNDGLSRTPRKTSRKNRKGLVKVGHFCIAKMQAWMDEENKVNVKYYPTHSHKCSPSDVYHHPLSHSTNKYINEKLASKIPPAEVYRQVLQNIAQNTSTGNVDGQQKSQVLTLQRIRERARKIQVRNRLHNNEAQSQTPKIRERSRPHKNEAQSLAHLAHQLHEENDYALIYKPFKGPVEFNGPKEVNDLPDADNLFMLGIQTPRQADLMAQHCHEIVVVDEAHGTSCHGFHIFNVVIVDANGRGWPVAHLITSKSDAEAMQYFFKTLEARLPKGASINNVITDDYPALINAMELGFSKEIRHILCKWRMLKNLKENIRSKQGVPENLQDVMMNELQSIVNAKDIESFHNLCSIFLTRYGEESSGGSKFVEYFQRHYLSRADKWAMCHRTFPHRNVDTISHVESFHARLNKTYLKRKVEKRLDDLVNILLEIESHDYLTRMQEEELGLVYLKQDISERHQKGMLIPDDYVTKIDGSMWEVWSRSGNTNIIVRYHEECPLDLCLSKCIEAPCHGLCVHMFSCSCPDVMPLCKHIHKLQSLLCQNIAVPVICSRSHEDTEMDINILLERNADLVERAKAPTPSSPEIGNTQNMCESLEKNISLLNNFLKIHAATNPNALSHAVAVTGNLIVWLNHATAKNDITAVVPTEPAQKSDEKLKTQFSPIVSFKRPEKRRKKKDTVSSPKKKKSAEEGLLSHPKHSTSSDNDEDDDLIPAGPPECKSSFTPPLSYSNNPSDFILKCSFERISLINLKSLDLSISDEEAKRCKEVDPIFNTGFLYSSIISAFLSKLTEKNPSCLSFTTELAIRASRRCSNVIPMKRLLKNFDEKVNTLFFPANLTSYNWCIVAVVLSQKPQVMYYDPLQESMSDESRQLVMQVIADLHVIFPLLDWDHEVTYMQMEKQCDSINCGIHICRFALQTALNEPYHLIDDIFSFRKDMYSLIVGKCLRRSNFDDESCGVCSKMYSEEVGDDKPWISCEACEQWYHESCVSFLTAHGRFVCQ